MLIFRRITTMFAMYGLLLAAVCLQSGCGNYTNPPKEFKDSYIITEASGMGELGTIDEFQKGLAKLKMDNGKTPEIHGWKKNDNVYQLCFSMKDQECEAQFTFILGGTGVDPKKIGKACTLDYITAGEGRSEGVGASSIILLAVNALQESGVETSIQRHEQERKKADELSMARVNLIRYISDLGNESAYDIPPYFRSLLTSMVNDDKFKEQSEITAYLKQHAEEIANISRLHFYVSYVVDYSKNTHSGVGSVESIAYEKLGKGELKNIDDLKRYLKSENVEFDETICAKPADKTNLTNLLGKTNYSYALRQEAGKMVDDGRIKSYDELHAFIHQQCFSSAIK